MHATLSDDERLFPWTGERHPFGILFIVRAHNGLYSFNNDL